MSQPIDDGGAAFPHEELVNNLYDDKGRITGSRVCYAHPGMTLRDWFAGQALAGLLADPNNNGHYTDNASASYRYADAMLLARLTKPE